MAKSAFDNLEMDDLSGFEPDLIFSEGKPDKNGSVAVNPIDILEGRTKGNADDDDDDDVDTSGTTGKKGKKEDEADVNALLDEALDDFEQGGKKKKGEASDDDDDELEEDDDDLEEGKTKGKAGDDSSDTDDDKPNPFQAYYQLMVETGLWEEDDEFDGTEKKLIELQAKNNEKAIEDGIDEYLENAFAKNPDGAAHGKKLLQHLASGGTVQTFLDAAVAEEFDEEQLDAEDEATAESAATTMLQDYYKLMNMKPEKISANIKKLKTKGLLIDTAKDLVDTYKEMAEDRRQEDITRAKEAQDKAVKAQRQYTATVLNILEKETEVRGAAIGSTKKEKEKLKQYMFQPSVEVGDRKVSEFHKDLAELRSNPEWNIFLANAVQQFKTAKPGKTAGKADNTSGGKDGKKTSLKSVVQNLTKNVQNAASSGSASASQRTPVGTDVKKAWHLE